MLDQPDHILSTAAAHEVALHGRYNFFSTHYTEDPFHEKVIHKSLARNLNDLIPAMEDEVKYSIDTVFGFDTKEWKKVNVWKSWLAIVPYITNRMLVGFPLCRNKEFLGNCVRFTDDVVRNMFLIGFTPMVFRPVVGRIASWANWWHWKQSSKYSLPIITKRIYDMQRKEAGDPEYVDWTPPEDFITWTIRIAKQDKNEFESSPEVISKRIMPLEFAATHTTSLTGHGVILDLLSSDPALGYLEGIREEAARVLQEEGGHWTKSGLARLFKLDSAIRESMRVSNFAQTLVERKVVSPEGITHEQEGWHVPYGQYFILNLNGVQHDNELFPNADTFDAFRYSKQREEYEARSQDEKDSDEGLRLKKTGMVTTGDTHLPFGHGRHACPGRFFVAHELKMALAYLLLNYDVKRLPERPKIRWIGPQFLPPMDACIEVRRRESVFVS
jgi:cytochrome P450